MNNKYCQRKFVYTNQILIQETPLSLIHVPLSLYRFYIEPILHLIKSAKSKNPPDFLNVAISPIECSIICSVESKNNLFESQRNFLREDLLENVFISDDSYISMQIDGEGMDASGLLSLTTPLAKAGVYVFVVECSPKF